MACLLACGLLGLPVIALAQFSPGGLVQLQVQQPGVDNSSPVRAMAAFDTPVVRVGDKIFYRVNIDATESAIDWPGTPTAPAGLTLTEKARGMITQMQINSFRPLTTFLFEAQASTTGQFTISNFTINVAGVAVEIPAATLGVVPASSPLNSAAMATRQLALQLSDTNVYLGQPFRARVMLPAGPNNEVEALREIQFSGDGLMTDKSASQQVIGPVSINGQLKMAYTSELAVTPITAGPLKFSAQGFTAGREFTPPISIHGQVSFLQGAPRYVLVVSDPVQINVRPLPTEGELPGFTGAIGSFFADPPHLTTNRLHVGEPAQLIVKIHGQGDLARLTPPVAPVSRGWDIIADPPPATSFTLIPLTDEVHETPAIPFSYFDPEIGKYVDLTIPSVPVTVVGEGLPLEMTASSDEDQTNAAPKLSSMATTPGTTVESLRPLQLSLWSLLIQLLPAAGFFALWRWDRRRRYLEAHPDVVLRAQARRALRREKKDLHQAAAAGDEAAFARHATRAFNIAVAPQFPANPRALVSDDVLAKLNGAETNAQAADTVRKVFATANAQYATETQGRSDLIPLLPEIEAVLTRLEEKL